MKVKKYYVNINTDIMGWTYFTTISPVSNNSFDEAFGIFLSQCLIREDIIRKQLSDEKCFRFVINTNENNDKIVCTDGRIFYKSKFLSSKNFKKSLIDYYKPLGIFVKGPKELIKRDGTITNRWIIELSPIYLS